MTVKRLKNKLALGAAFLADRDGAAAIVLAFMTPILIGGLAYGAELGAWEMTKRRIQNAADTAAYAAGTQVRSGADIATIATAALQVATDSGYKSGSAGITVASPPTSAPLAVDGTDPNGDARFVHVVLTETVRRNFTRYFAGGSTIDIVSQAVARVENGRPACVLSLHPSAAGAIATGGSANVTLAGCDVAANSISSSAIQTTGGSTSIETNCASTVGGVDDSHGAFTYTECAAAIENAALTADPYRFVGDPSVNCSSYQNANQFTNNGNPSSPGSAGSPGVPAYNCYQGVGSLTRDVALKSNAVYVLKDSHVRLSGGKDITGASVTIYLMGNSSISVQGNTTINITAPTTGPYKGIAIMGDRNNAVDMDLTGNSGVSIVGAVYSPNSGSDIVYTGNNSSFTAGQCTQVIGGTVTFWGSADFDTDCSNSGTTEIKTAQSIQIVR